MEALRPSKTLVEQAYDALLEAICTGDIKAGDRLNQDELALRLNVSRQPINSAIAMLKAQRFVQDTGKRGVIVAPIDQNLFDSIYQFRTAIEPLAVELAVTRMTNEAITIGRDIIARGKSCVQSGDHAAALRADMDFHGLIYRLSGNLIIADTMTLNWRHLQRAMSEVLSVPGTTLRVWKEHDQIFNAMVRGDGDSAAGLMKAHMENAAPRKVRLGT
ncbi:GntR family transcriptional regulator [Cereibacter sphaeroides]|jgi:DNA-binding GntR family transcriptional regulator|uniref:GntR family transcriptional regulator n=1 Tax=Cereibacter sphaeroides TaxID=1063 RepID=A0AAX1UEW4_CERSP|nr:GntR family transcriptional regulator [Cereibacter sphaeroides]ABN78739.1 transcriptional regulator, GntR family [Cereibacter sphaeroides ATCC 17029]EKX56884.1 transcriptional regulator, GntR family [Rhodobacter sp. AKP1]ACM02966.1 Transcriptional regulator, GntR family [Cereibacter sphaeroides KD131]AZB65383.1 GntR family transcriptional regulator [Cereibacter sphaeroides]AZB70079.1 GntR family transcriptional regulator [Cereibacter sphaeroides]